MKINERIESSFDEVDRLDNERLDNFYTASQVYDSLGLSRETIRYYEKLGLLSPLKQSGNNYRQFTVYDFQRLMIIDAFKKRGFTASQICSLMSLDTPEALAAELAGKAEEIREHMILLEKQLHQIEQDRCFIKELPQTLHQFTIRSLPLYRVCSVLPAITSFEEYADKVLNRMDLDHEDILNKLIRFVHFDHESGYRNSQICVVELAETAEEGQTYLHSGRCIYSAVASEIGEMNTMGRMFELTSSWIDGQQLSDQGVVYIRPRCVLAGKLPAFYYESWVPLND